MTIQYILNQIEVAAARLLEAFPQNRVFAFSGPMGSGKTTLVAAICRELGVGDTVTSPTFPIINEYRLPGGEPVYHIDLYRLAGAEEAVSVGVEETLYSGSHCFVEWPDRASALLPEHTVYVQINVVSASERRLEASEKPGFHAMRQ
jgi:tRNA threonylcarbamoyladenosine biosynthesis protein TsaE